MALLETGTITVTNASTTVTGAGTNWLVSGVLEGDVINIYATAGIVSYPISADVTVDTSLTLPIAYAGSTEAGLSYSIVRTFGSDKAADTYRALNENIALIRNNSGLLGISVDAVADDIAGRATYDGEAEGFVVLVIDADGDGARSALYVMGSGGSADWSDAAYITGSTAAVLADLGVNNITVSTAAPSGGSDGDLWFRVPV